MLPGPEAGSGVWTWEPPDRKENSAHSVRGPPPPPAVREPLLLPQSGGQWSVPRHSFSTSVCVSAEDDWIFYKLRQFPRTAYDYEDVQKTVGLQGHVGVEQPAWLTPWPGDSHRSVGPPGLGLRHRGHGFLPASGAGCEERAGRGSPCSRALAPSPRIQGLALDSQVCSATCLFSLARK